LTRVKKTKIFNKNPRTPDKTEKKTDLVKKPQQWQHWQQATTLLKLNYQLTAFNVDIYDVYDATIVPLD